MRLKFHSLSSKVIGIFLLLTLLSVAALNSMAYVSSSSIFQRQSQKTMNSTLTFRGDMLTSDLSQFESQAISVAKIEAMQSAIVSLRSGWKTLETAPGKAREALVKAFMTDNPYGADEREKLVKPEGASIYYFTAHERTQTDVAAILKGTDFTDLLIADIKGNVIYSYKKGPAFAASLMTADWAASSLGKTFAGALDAAAKAGDEPPAPVFSGTTVDPASGKSGIYYAVPIVKLGAVKGVIILQVRDSAIVTNLTKGLVSTSSETALVFNSDGQAIGPGANGQLAALDASPYAKAVSAALQSDAMTEAPLTLNGQATLGYFRPVSFADRKIVVAETMAQQELLSGSLEIARNLLLMGLGVLALLSLTTAFFANRLFAPLARLAQLTRAVSEGKLDGEIGNETRKDEIGTMARALGRFRVSLLDQRALEAQTEANRALTEQERQQRLAEKDAEARTLQRVVQSLDQGLMRLVRGLRFGLAFASLADESHEPSADRCCRDVR